MQLKVFGLPIQTLLTMKLLILLMVAACLQVSARGFSQAITLSLRDAPLEKVFTEIKKQSGYSFVYTRSQLEGAARVTISVRGGTINDVLDVTLRNQSLTYVIDGQYIVLQSKVVDSREMAIPILDISGRLINDKGEAVAHATIQVKGSGKITRSDADGHFIIKGVSAGDVLLITAAETETKEVKVGNEQHMVITMIARIGKLDEAIVIGYGTTTRRFSTGSVSKVSSSEIVSQPVTNPLSALQGRVAGLDVTATSGVPGSTVNIQVRGQNSINPNPGANRGIAPLDNPLIIIDGVPFAPQNGNINMFRSLAAPGNPGIYGNPYGGLSPFNSINPADIESIEVLRDASETAIYGSRGANGVILITMKKGRIGKTNVGVNVYTGQSHASRTMEMMKTKEYLMMRREAFANAGITPSLDPSSAGYAPDLLAFDTTRYTDWKEYFLGGTATMTNANISVSGGSVNTQFLIGGGYVRESYIFPGDFANKRGSVNVNLSHRSTDNRFDAEFSANYSYTTNNSSGTPDLLMAFTMPPNYPSLFEDDGQIRWEYNAVLLSGDAYANPIAYLKRLYRSKTTNLISHFQMGYELYKGLRLKTSFGYNTMAVDENSKSPKASFDPSSTMTSSADFGVNNFTTWIIEPQLEYKANLLNGRFQVLAGGTIQRNTNAQTQLGGLNYPDDNLLGSISSAGIKTASDNFSEYRYAAIFGRINYVLGNRYIINVNGRRDGSSRFGPGRKFGNFYSVGAGWIFTESSFLKSNAKWLSFGKLRGSYGTAGNDNIGNYQYLSRWQATANSYNGAAGYIPQNLPNDEYSWSVTRKLEIGLELGFLQNRISLSSAWYRNRSGNQLVSFLLPNQTGFSNVTANFPALVQNTGVELQFNASIIQSKRFSWSGSIIATFPENKLVSFPGIETSSYSNIYIVGQSLSALRGFDYQGVNETTGLYQFNSRNGLTSTPSSLVDYILLGDRDKSFFGGLSNNFTLQNFRLDVFFDFAGQKGLTYLKYVNNGRQPGANSNQPTTVLSRWQKPGDITNIQRFDSRVNNQAAVNFSNSSGSFSDASYIRLKTLALSYSLPAKVLSKLKLDHATFFINAQNLFTITGYEGNDPETMLFYSMPVLRTIVVGLNLNL